VNRKKTDRRLPLRWGVILIGALGTACVVASASGTIAAGAAALAVTALLHRILDNA
jgi:hypothetical protein